VTTAQNHIAVVDAATERLLDSLAGLSDEEAHASSRLPGWTRGHVITHLARSADGMGNLMTWAATGVETPMYVEPDGRNADIEAGAGRPASELVADVRAASQRWSERAAALPADAWTATIRRRPHLAPEPAANLLTGRLFEVEFHHVDLGLPYTFADSPPDVVESALRSTQRRLAVTEPFVAQASDAGWTIAFPGDAPAAAPVIEGTAAALLSWLTGRSAGADLQTVTELPALPPWT
jgi:maleylpyruvate isomerase